MQHQSITDGFCISPDGTVLAWASGESFSLTPTTYTNAVAVATGSSHLLVLHADGRVSGMHTGHHTDDLGQQSVPPEAVDVVAISCGVVDSYALRSDGTVVAWGNLTADQIASIGDYTDITAISAGRRHLLLRTDLGRVAHWGETMYNEGDAKPVRRLFIQRLHTGDHRAIVLSIKGEVYDLFRADIPCIAADTAIVDVVATRGLYGVLYADGRALLIDVGTKIPQTEEEDAEFGPYPVPDEPVFLHGVSALSATGDSLYAVGFDGRVWAMYSGEQFGVEAKALHFPADFRVRVWPGLSSPPADYDAAQCHAANTAAITAGEVRFRHTDLTA
jgi:alpha-tubulin suppressor-like RCC1 family protein